MVKKQKHADDHGVLLVGAALLGALMLVLCVKERSVGKIHLRELSVPVRFEWPG